MRHIRANFAKPAKPTMLAWAGAAALAIASITAAAATWSEWNHARNRAQELQAATEMHDVPSSAPPTALPQSYDANARELIGTRSFPWTDALTMLESTAVVGVTVTQVDFAAGEQAMRAEVTFADYSSVLDYLNALNAAAPMVHWSLNQTQGQTLNATAVLLGRPESQLSTK